MPHRTPHLAAMLAAVAALAACTPAPEREARAAAERYLEAWRFRDADALFGAHAASSARGTYCSSSAFAALHDRIKRTTSAESCADARGRSPDADADPEVALLHQLVRFVCEEPSGSCRDYQRRVFDAWLTESMAWEGALERAEVASVEATEDTARARVELTHSCCAAPERMTLELELAPTGWRILGPPLPSLSHGGQDTR